jgi:predicted HTH transcriptional regulator
LIRRVTSIAGYAEEYGTGTLRMIEEMKKAGLPEPKVGFWARLFGGGGKKEE